MLVKYLKVKKSHLGVTKCGKSTSEGCLDRMRRGIDLTNAGGLTFVVTTMRLPSGD